MWAARKIPAWLSHGRVCGVRLTHYPDRQIAHHPLAFMEVYYNRQRLHSTPATFSPVAL